MQTKTETCFVRVGPWVPGQPQQTLNFFVILFTKLGLCLFRLTFQTKIKSSSHSIMNLFHHGAYQQSTRSIFFNLETILRTFPIQFCASRQARISGTQSQASRWDREKFPSISDFVTKSRIVIQTILTRILENLICCLQLDWYFSKKMANNFLIFLKIIT